ncbi:GGDEF domain-containing protein [Atopomonas sediminilitoris]|uniref:GGDEF domain-containing protein n=1 Tax=Atopomonas sediminilitoris TaxID=2919919 RepID=UPI001F4D9214|nr:GGDEF domain-containing protein [Atopomonas sediminilitoris]
MTDPLTQAYNRRFFDEQGRQEVHRAERYGTPLSLLMWDIDHFKAINDRYGHEWGDRVLQQFVQSFTGRLRQSDYLCRIGGEEFAILLPQSDLEAARQLAESLLQLCEEQRLPRVGKVTASFAVVAWQAGESLAQTVNRADALLYQAKAEGRACVRG